MPFHRRVRQLTIANPCSESWESMSGGERDRFCTACNRSVYDLSALTSRQAAELLDSKAGKVCGRISYDERGNQVFAKEHTAVGRLMQISLLGASAVASAAAAPDCELKVRVIDPAGYIVPKAIVKIAKTAGAEAVTSGTSSDQGEFTGRIASGTYYLQVESPGFMSFQQQLTCKASEIVSVDAPLRLGLMGDVVEIRPDRFPLLAKLRSIFHRL
jgi:hypothetical protein